MLNPNGMAKETRENADGIDLNRDYLFQKTAEVKAHVRWLKKHPAPDLFLSLHEDWESTGFYLYEITTSPCCSHATAILQACSDVIPTEPEPVIDDHPVREPGWIFHKAEADFPDHWPEAIYLAKNNTPQSYTLETPSSLELEKRIACHKKAVSHAVDTFLKS